MTYMFILKCALKLVLKNILYYDARSEKHQISNLYVCILITTVKPGYNVIGLCDTLSIPSDTL